MKNSSNGETPAFSRGRSVRVLGADGFPRAGFARYLQHPHFELKLLDCYKHREVQVFASVLDDDFVITFEDGSTYSKTGYLAYSTSSSTRIETAEISEMRIRLHGETAVVTGMYHEKGIDSQKAYDYHDRFTDVWMKKSGKWQLIAAHYSVPTK